MDWLREHLWETWLGISVFLVVLELASMDFILLMLAGGAFVGFLAALLGLPFPIQVVAFAIASVAGLLLARPSVVRRMHRGPDLQLGHAKLVGAQGVVTQEITAQQPGRITLNGEIWSAAPYDSTESIAEGQVVEVLEIKGATALVHPLLRGEI